jgi:hypothetical protein
MLSLIKQLPAFDNDKFIIFDSRCVVLSDEFFGTEQETKTF